MSMAKARAFTALGAGAGGLGEALMRVREQERLKQYDQMAQERHGVTMDDARYSQSRRPFNERREEAGDLGAGIFGNAEQLPENAGTTVPLSSGGVYAPEWQGESRIARTMDRTLPAYAKAHEMETGEAAPFLESQLRGSPISYSPVTRDQGREDQEFSGNVSLGNALSQIRESGRVQGGLQDDSQEHDIGKTMYSEGMEGLQSRAYQAIAKYNGDPDEAIRQIRAEDYSRRLRGSPGGLPGASALVEQIQRIKGERNRREFLGIGGSGALDLTDPSLFGAQ